MYLQECMHTFGEIKLGHRDRENAPRGTYDEDYHFYLYDQMVNGNYNCFKVVVAKNGSSRKVLKEQITKAEYFKRKLDGTLKEDETFRDSDV